MNDLFDLSGKKAISSVTLFAGVFALASTIAGFTFRPLPVWKRVLLFGVALLLIIPEAVTDIIGVGFLIVIFFFEWRAGKKTAVKAGE